MKRRYRRSKIKRCAFIFLVAACIVSVAVFIGRNKGTAPAVSVPDSALSQATGSPSAVPAQSSAVTAESKSQAASSGPIKLDNESYPQKTDHSLPPLTSDEAFNVAFSTNPVDAAYNAAMKQAASTNDMVTVFSGFSSAWDKEVDNAYNQLLPLTSGGAHDTLQKEQGEWRASLDSALQAIRDEVNASQTGSMAQVTAASKKMDYIKARAVKLYQQLYAYNKSLTYAYKGN